MSDSPDQSEEVVLGLSQNEALVLFEYLSRCDQDGNYQFVDQAEQRVLWDLVCLLEKQLVTILDSRYDELVEQARKSVRERME